MLSRREVILVLGMGILVLLAYLPSFPGEFHFDDFALMLENPYVTAPHFSYDLFLQEYGGRPLTLWTFHWNYWLSGANPLSYHAFNLLVHFVASVLLLIWLVQRISDQRAAVLAAAVFALHPLQTQAVDYIWSRSVLLMFCFGVASLLFAGMKPRSGRMRFVAPVLALVCFQLAIWSRTDGLIFLIPLVLAGGLPRRVSDARSAWYRPLAFVLVALINLGAFALFMSKAKPSEIGWTHPDVFGYWWSQTVAFWKYVAMMVWPVGLSVDHDFAVAGSWPPLLALLGLSVLAVVLWKIRNRYPLVVCGVLWIGLALAPAALVPNSDPFNESRAYPALAGLAVVLAGLFQAVATRLPRRAVPAIAVLLLLALFSSTAARNEVWRTDLALWQDAAEKSPAKGRVYYNLGAAWARAGDVDRAEQSFSTALALEPDDDLANAALGYCAESRRDWSLAVQRYQRAVSLNSRNSYADEGLKRVLKHVEAGPGKQRL